MSVALAMKIWLIFLLVWTALATTTTAKHYQNDFTKNVVQSREGSIDITKITGWTNTGNVAAFTVTVLASQIIVATGWLIFGDLIFYGKTVYKILKSQNI